MSPCLTPLLEAKGPVEKWLFITQLHTLLLKIVSIG